MWRSFQKIVEMPRPPKPFLPPQGGEKWLCIFTFLFMMFRFFLIISYHSFFIIFPQYRVSGGGDLLHRDHLPSLPDRGRDQLCGQFNALFIFLFIFVFAFIFAFVFIFLLNLYLPPMIEVETIFVVIFVSFFSSKSVNLPFPQNSFFPFQFKFPSGAKALHNNKNWSKHHKRVSGKSKETIWGGAMRMQEKGNDLRKFCR